jgi:hypothetical protein
MKGFKLRLRGLIKARAASEGAKRKRDESHSNVSADRPKSIDAFP